MNGRHPWPMSGAAVALAMLLAGCWSWDPPDRENLVENPGCDEGTASWYAYHSVLAQTTQAGHSGPAACEVSYETGPDYSIVASIMPAPPRSIGLQAAAWVRSSVSVGKTCGLVLRQQPRDGPAIERRSEVSLTREWQLVTTSYEVETSGPIDLYVYQLAAGRGDAFEADDVTAVITSTP